MITSTLGKALGGAAGGFVASSRGGLATCWRSAHGRSSSRTRSRRRSPAGARPRSACSASEPALVDRLHANTDTFRDQLREVGFQPLDGEAAIIPIIVGETAFAIELSRRLLDEGVFVTGFGYPVVPEGRRGSGCRCRRRNGRAPRPRARGLREGRADAGLRLVSSMRPEAHLKRVLTAHPLRAESGNGTSGSKRAWKKRRCSGS